MKSYNVCSLNKMELKPEIRTNKICGKITHIWELTNMLLSNLWKIILTDCESITYENLSDVAK